VSSRLTGPAEDRVAGANIAPATPIRQTVSIGLRCPRWRERRGHLSHLNLRLIGVAGPAGCEPAGRPG